MAADWQKASIGNYKGVMLCNRPNEFGMQKRPDPSGKTPFNSRVNPTEPIGWNPTMKLLPKKDKRKKCKLSFLDSAVNPNSVLLKHKRYLRELEDRKNREREDQIRAMFEEEIKIQQFKEKAEIKRA
jgi:hypothetical protein